MGSVVGVNDIYCISSKSANKDAAWEFLRYYLTDEYQDKQRQGLPVKKARLEEMAQEAMMAGVDIIVGAHPHGVQGIGTTGNTVVLWSLGNLMFGGTHDMTTFDATLAQVRLRFDGDEYVGCTVDYIPILTSSADPANDFHPVVAEGSDKARILEKIQADSAFRVTEAMYFPAK